MNAKKFVSLWKEEIDSSLNLYKDPNQESLVQALYQKLDLTPEQEKTFWEVAEVMLNDTAYTFLLALDGCAQIGGDQQTYKIFGEDGDLISDCGDIEAAAGDLFE
ncbi:hypothetical protein DRW07_14870 [Alteromonas sediminis]|uniref:Uncharacterized protein n=1 Tax=Alteromonas sediminis TaxID=2259342 RepID=A0A3N5Y6G9_9ALTE|nr:hypothetical protein [Alteromonas sediminis]RPJ66079.1 hypothetical protein DRW07_14870 [Alteromonas sediminis]